MNRNPNDEESIFATAIEIDSPAEREAYVKSVCGENAGLHDRLQALLKSHVEETGRCFPLGYLPHQCVPQVRLSSLDWH